jgi:hypothetical protein
VWGAAQQACNVDAASTRGLAAFSGSRASARAARGMLSVAEMNSRVLRLRPPLASALLALLLSSSALGCANTLPDPIYANQVDEYFPEPEAEAPDAEARRTVRHEAEVCALRLNDHRSSTEVVSIIQSIISSIASVTSAVGGVLSVVDFGNPDITTAMGSMSAAGAAVGLAGNLIIGFAANPLEQQRLHAQGLRSWELAVELRYGGSDPEIVRESLVRCQHDEAPPVRVVGAGIQFTL